MKTWLMTFPEDKPAIDFYSGYARTFGAVVHALAANDPAPDDLSGYAGLLLSGGGDVDPARYGDGGAHEKCYGVSAARDSMELNLIEKFIGAGKPIVGICRGLQILTVYFGGKLHQHVPDVVAEETERHRVPKGFDCLHPVLFDGATRLGSALRGVDEVNSAHHQAMHSDAKPQHLRVAATSPCGITEAAECFDFPAPIIAVQWHPERLPDDHPARARLADFIRGAIEASQQQQQQ